MLLRLPGTLHYPIRITHIKKRVSDPVSLNDSLFTYTYRTQVAEGQRNKEEDKQVERDFTTQFYSTLEGTIARWRVWDGDIISEPIDVCEITEECPHEVQFNGLCTNCGKDLTRDVLGGNGAGVSSEMERAPIRMAHDTPLLSISQDEAAKIDTESKQRLLAGRKLSLVVDLDQTIIHAAVDPTIGEWQKDTDNPNHEAVKHVRSFQLLDDGPGMRGCWYYIKLRPGLEEFLENVAQLYELHIYTMGTRQYAKQIAMIVDPDQKYFGDRILSRDESGSMVAKNLERLFPIDTKMVVIIDDRGDVWKWSANLVRVTPFDFFVGIGDINSSFLPKKQEIQATAPVKEDDKPPALPKSVDNAAVEESNGVAEDGTSTLQNGTSALENLLAMSGSNDAAVRQEQTDSQEKTITSQLEEKPLEKMQRQQDEKDAAESGDGTDTQTNGETSPSQISDLESNSTDSDSGTPKRHRHSILKDDDEELIHLEAALTAVHTAFFREWDRKRISGKGGRVAALAGNRKAPLPELEADDGPANLSLVPDIKRIMPAMKVRILSSVVIVFSGVLPLGTDIQSADISTWAKTFGATIREEVGRDVTHVIAARAGTAKVKRAMKRGIKVVSTAWLFESMQQWRKLDERPYFLEGASKPESIPASSPTRSTGEDAHMSSGISMSTDLLLSDSEDTDLSGTDAEAEGDESRPNKRIKLDKLDTGVVITDDPEEYTPPTLNQEDYDKINEELREFMGSDMDSESDNESVRSELSVRNKKRTRAEMDAPLDGATLSPEKRNGVGGSRLKAVSNANANGGTLGPESASTAPTRKTSSSAKSTNDLTAEAEARSEDRREDERIRQDQQVAEAADREAQAVQSDSDDEEQRELEELLGGLDSDEDELVEDQ